MRRILVKSARRKKRDKQGGGQTRDHLDPDGIAGLDPAAYRL
jgi:hypothetical protein